MGTLEQSHQGTKAGGAFGQALAIKGQLGEIAAESTDYPGALHAIVRLCQDALAKNARHGEAQVLLANAFYLLHLKNRPRTGSDLPFRLAAATIQHWSDQGLCPDSSTKNADPGCRVHEVVTRALAEICPDCAEGEEREKRYLERELYATALVTEPSEWMAV